MKRDPEQLASRVYDLLVIGGGITGACIAWDAALRGLSVALVDKGDFGHATSANSLKTIHGGLRYLQDANLSLVRRMIQERKTWMRIAPHLVHPLPCVMPTYKRPTRSRAALAAALTINDLIGFDRNLLMDSQKRLPNGRTVSRSECLEMLPGAVSDDITGGAVWYDAQMHNSERLLLSFLLSAARAGAKVANYVEVTGFLRSSQGVRGVKAKDLLTGQELEIRAELVINSAGAWVDSVLSLLNPDLKPRFCLSTAMDLVTRQILPKHAIGISSQYALRTTTGDLAQYSRLLFIVPWRGYSLIGTIHSPCAGQPGDPQVTEENIETFLDEINTAYPGAALTRQDVYHVHWGFLPMDNRDDQPDVVKLVRQDQLHDHEREEGIEGLITVVSVKYTTARHVAQAAVDLAVQKLRRRSSECRTHVVPIYGGQIEQFDDFMIQTLESRPPELAPAVMKHLLYNYGSDYLQVLRHLEEEPEWCQTISPGSSVLRAEVIHAIRHEMAQKLIDVVQRRTDLGAAGLPDEASLHACADLMGPELGWDQARKERELEEVRMQYAVTTALSTGRDGIGAD
jgi:glycerol-3-phosphate dehydrogenase